LHYIFETETPQSPAKPLQNLIVLKEIAADCRRWVKETQLERARVGQPVDITIDALPHYRFTGRVDSLQPGTGSNFALLPPDNATGNFIKIVQRVPVKILFDPESIKAVRDKIVPGLSTVPSIAVTQPLIDKPYPEAPEYERPSHQPANEPITQIRDVPATGVMQ